jgi:hypothetical protein
MHSTIGLRLLIALIIAGVTAISAWIIGIQMKRRIKKDLGRKATESDLTSIDTWMKVEEEEEKNDRDKLLKPE